MTEEQKEMIARALRERLEEHNENRKTAQKEAADGYDALIKKIGDLEAELSKKIEKDFAKESDRLQSALDDLPQGEGEDPEKFSAAIQKVKTELSKRWICSLKKEHYKAYEVESEAKHETGTTTCGDTVEGVKEALNKCLEEADQNRKAVQEDLHSICDESIKRLTDIKEDISGKLEEEFKREDSRLQSTLNTVQSIFTIKEANNGYDDDELLNIIKKAKAELVVKQMYRVKAKVEYSEQEALVLEAKKEIKVEWLEHKRPTDLKLNKVSDGKVFLGLIFLTPEEEKVLKENDLEDAIKYVVS